MLSARAARIAARRRGFMLGSGRPIFAATVISRASLPNTFDLMASCRPLRCMMFLNWEWPANGASSYNAEFRDFGAPYRAVRRENLFPECGPRFLKPPADPHRRDARCQARRIVGLDRDGAQRCRPQRRLELA